MRGYIIGTLEIDEASRRLSIDGVEIAAQPLVFAFLVYLLANADRAVSKEELLTVLWPGVHVAESSLQRVASLARGLLRRAGSEEALESVQRFGYRLRPGSNGATAGPEPAPTLDAARSACSAKRWQDAASLFARAAAEGTPLTPADLDLWGLALECAGRPSLAIEPLTRALSGHAAEGDRLAAARPALALSRIHLERAEFDVARGWHGRAGDLIGETEDAPEKGLWFWMGSRLAAAAGETELALSLADRAYGIGRAVQDPVVESLGLIYRGFFTLCLGDTARGIEDQNLAATLGLSSEIDPVVGGTIYCNLLWACRNLADWTRANHWSANYERWCRASGLDSLTGSCRLHRAEVLGIQGTLEEAKQLVLSAIAMLEDDAPWAIGDALRVLGDIHLAAGDLALAEDAYHRAVAVGWSPQPGLAFLQLERGEPDAAILGLERCLQARSWPAQQRRGLVLASLAKIAALAGRQDRAREIVVELETSPARWPMASIRALTAEARAALQIAAGDTAAAVSELQSACDLWNEAGSALNAAEARLWLAEQLLEEGDAAGASIEVKAAAMIAERTGSGRLLRRCRAIRAQQGDG